MEIPCGWTAAENYAGFAMQIWNVSMECVLTLVASLLLPDLEQNAGMAITHSTWPVLLAAIQALCDIKQPITDDDYYCPDRAGSRYLR